MFEMPKERADTVDSIKSRHQNWSTESGVQDPLDIDARPLEVDITPWNPATLLVNSDNSTNDDFRPKSGNSIDEDFTGKQRMDDLIQVESIKTLFTINGMYI